MNVTKINKNSKLEFIYEDCLSLNNKLLLKDGYHIDMQSDFINLLTYNDKKVIPSKFKSIYIHSVCGCVCVLLMGVSCLFRTIPRTLFTAGEYAVNHLPQTGLPTIHSNKHKLMCTVRVYQC